MKKEMCRITIAIPAFNASATIDNAVKSVFLQTEQNWRLVLIDDGSKDDTFKIIQKYKFDPRVTIISDGENLGLIARLNQSIQMTKTEFYCRMDADDLMHPARLKEQLAIFDANPLAHVAHSSVFIIDEANRVCGQRDVPRTTDPALQALTFGRVIHPTTMMRMSWLKDHMYRGEFLRAEDRELFVREYDSTVIVGAERPLLYYRVSAGMKKSSVLAGYRTERQIMRIYGAKLIGESRVCIYLLRSFMKSLYVTLFGLKRFSGNKASPLPLEELGSAQRVVDDIVGYAV